jgi:hypothetical protein
VSFEQLFRPGDIIRGYFIKDTIFAFIFQSLSMPSHYDNPTEQDLKTLASQLGGDLYTDFSMRLMYGTDASAYREIPLAGQVVGNGLVVDVSRYMNRILELNANERWVRVQPGVVLDELNQFLEPAGLFSTVYDGSTSQGYTNCF